MAGEGQNQRQVKNLLINPRIQLRLYAPFLVMIALFTLVIDLLILYSSSQLNQTVLQSAPELAPQVSAIFFRVVIISGVGLVVIGVIGFLLALTQTHRVVGPLVPISRQLRKLAEGNYEGEIHLRKKDELKEIAADINSVTKRLRELAKK
jgi:signal transduction histidine kinase